MIHRDLKPANVLLTKELVSRVGDFGESTRYQEKESGGPQEDDAVSTQVGTPIYMAPEITMGENYNKSVACVFASFLGL